MERLAEARAEQIFEKMTEGYNDVFTICTYPFGEEGLYLKKVFRKVGINCNNGEVFWQQSFKTNHSFGCCRYCGNIVAYSCDCDHEYTLFDEDEVIEQIADTINNTYFQYEIHKED